MPAAQQLSAKEVALELKTDARTLRKFLREITPKDDQPGQGGRWSFTKGDVKKLTKQFETWAEKGAKAKAEAVEGAVTKAKSKKAKKSEEPEEIDSFVNEDEPDTDDDGNVVELSDEIEFEDEVE